MSEKAFTLSKVGTAERLVKSTNFKLKQPAKTAPLTLVVVDSTL